MIDAMLYKAGREYLQITDYAREGNEGALRNALEHLLQTPKEYVTPLHVATMANQIGCMRICLEYGINVNAKTPGGCTHLVKATTVEAARLLLDWGANMQLRDGDDRLPLEHFLQIKHLGIAALLIDRGAHDVYDFDYDQNPDRLEIMRYRDACGKAVVSVVGICFFKLSSIRATRQDVNIIEMIGKHIWSTRIMKFL